MPIDGAGAVHAVRLRVARLAADGTTPAGASNAYVSSALVRVAVSPQYTEGERIAPLNGAGIPCFDYQEPTTFTRVNLTVEICTPDEELEEILAGGTIITSGGETIGHAAPETGTEINPNGISLEWWDRAIVGSAPATTNPYRWYVAPRVYLRRADWESGRGAQGVVFEGHGVENANWGNGPFNDWPVGAISSRAVQRIRTATIPAAALGYTAVPVQT